MVTIEVKNKNFNGERAGIGFVNGVAQVEKITPEQKAFFKSMGYTVKGTGNTTANKNSEANQ